MGALMRWVNPKTYWDALQMDVQTLLQMMKGALTPVIVVAIHQSSAVANVSVTFGYLAALISVSAQCLAPRGKFIKTMLFSILASCSAAALCCLASYTAIEARRRSNPAAMIPDAEGKVPYNSDANVVSAIWLLLSIWIANSLRAWRMPELQDPMVAFSIFVVVVLTRSGTIADIDEALGEIERLLKAFLIGLAVASGVSLLVLPSTHRRIIVNDVRGFAVNVDGALDSLVNFVQVTSKETLMIVPGDPKRTGTTSPDASEHPDLPDMETAYKGLSGHVAKLNALVPKIQGGLYYAKDEIAWGKLTADDLEKISGLLQSLVKPLSGLCVALGALDGFASLEPNKEGATSIKQGEADEVMTDLRSYLPNARDGISAFLKYFLVQLEIIHHNPEVDVKEISSEILGQPGASIKLNPSDPECIHLLDRLSESLRLAGEDIIDKILAPSDSGQDDVPSERTKHVLRQEYFLVMHVLSLMSMVNEESLALARFANKRAGNKAEFGWRIICPDGLKFWKSPFFQRAPGEDLPLKEKSNDDPPPVKQRAFDVADAVHLKPANIWERESGRLRGFLNTIGSDLSKFGMRVSIASFCVGIMAFLQATQHFFIYQRGVWAMIVIVIGMSPTSGQSFFGFLARIFASICSVILSLAAWYIAVGKTPGVIITLFLANMIEYYVYIRKPQFFGGAVIAIVTLNVIVGYELQVNKLGIERAESQGQPYYPIYIFGPYKLLAVIVGCAVSFFWVLFPFPISARSKVPRLVGQSLFGLAKIYSSMHSTIELWISSLNTIPKNLPIAHEHLKAEMSRAYKMELGLIQLFNVHANFARFEPPTGGKFPSAIYQELGVAIQNSVTILGLMGNIGNKLLSESITSKKISDESDDTWVLRLRLAASQSVEFHSHSLTSMYCHLSSAMTHQQALPPLLPSLPPFPLFRELQRLGDDIYGIDASQFHMLKAFISLEVLRTMLHFELEKLLLNTRLLVGEIRFDSPV